MQTLCMSVFVCVNYRLSSLLELNALLLSPPSGENVYGRQHTLINTYRYTNSDSHYYTPVMQAQTEPVSVMRLDRLAKEYWSILGHFGLGYVQCYTDITLLLLDACVIRTSGNSRNNPCRTAFSSVIVCKMQIQSTVQR